ncbi:MAG TPA: S41 family peptidase [Steroidobacteraceae bacterium]|nr:S41 family peptidase [Steroidobacteraceae bacterium]
MRVVTASSILLLAASLYGCGGGGGGGGTGGLGNNLGSSSTGSGDYKAGVFKPWSTYIDTCAAPTGNEKKGTTTDEKNFLRSLTNDLYLWYSEVPDLNPGTNTSVLDYFDELKTPSLTATGQKKDKFHFTYPTDAYDALVSGQPVGYGMEVAITLTNGNQLPRTVVVAYTEPSSPATGANLQRGEKILEVDGVSATNGNTDTEIAILNAGLFPEDGSASHTFKIEGLDQSTRTVTMTPTVVTSHPVQNVEVLDQGGVPVGYFTFNDHIEPAEDALIAAVNQLKQANVQDLVLDIRYNGGGYLDIASELAYMITGPAQTGGRTFELIHFNDKHPSTDPVTGDAITPTPFHATSQGFGGTNGATLPTLNLSRVYVLSGPDTCSASEAIINGLRGVGVDVYLIGATTCGKPYGFYAIPNCGTTYFTIQFKGTNDAGFSGYEDGFIPANEPGSGGARIDGCSVDDDFTHQLGDTSERLLKTALDLRAANNQLSACPAVSGFGGGNQLNKSSAPRQNQPLLRKNPLLTNRILRQHS